MADHVHEDYKDKDMMYSIGLEIPYGRQWREETRRHIEECDLFLVIATSRATYSQELAKEIEETKRLGKRIIPYRYSDIEWFELEELEIGSTQEPELDSKED